MTSLLVDSQKWLSGCRCSLRSVVFFCWLLLLLNGCSEGRGWLASGPDPPRFKNLVVIVVDALRRDHLPAYGYERATAPFVSELAESGIRLDGVSASSWTRPSVATLLTGLHPQRHGTNTRADKLPDDVPYLPEILGWQGFHSAGYTSNNIIGEIFGFARGYATYWSVWPSGFDRQPFTNPMSPLKPHASLATQSALQLSRSLEPPFFLYVHYLDPHDPYTPKRPWSGEAEAGGPYYQPEDWEGHGRKERTEAQLQRMIDQYDGTILETDREIRRLVEGLEEQGLLKETLLVVTADHGEEFLEHGALTHGKSLFEEVLQVPFILWSESGLESRKLATRFHHVDFLPTMFAALGVPIPDGFDGVDRWAAITTGDGPQASSFLHMLDLDTHAALAIVAPPHKLIHRLRQPRNLMFDLDEDPTEQVNRAADPNAGEALLRTLLRRHNELSSAGYAGENVMLDEDIREQLAALGYLQIDTPQAELEKRNLPSRLRYFGSREYGLFGNERIETLASILDFRGSSEQLLRGWQVAGAGEARTGPRASAVLATPVGSSTLTLKGLAPEQRRGVRIGLSIDDSPVEFLEVSAGEFELQVRLPAGAAADGLVWVDLILQPGTAGKDNGLSWREISIQ